MQTFRDDAGRAWNLALTIGDIRRVRTQAGVDLLEITAPRNGGTVALQAELQTDLVLLCDVLFALVEPQAKVANVNAEDFGRGLAAGGIVAGADAFWHELTDFFRLLPGRAGQVRLLETQAELLREIGARQIAVVEEAAAKLRSELAAGSGESSPSSPALPG